MLLCPVTMDHFDHTAANGAGAEHNITVPNQPNY